jgi:inner membrane transporter RhtA
MTRRSLGDLPAPAYFVGSAVFHYLGPAFAVLLFGLVPPVGVAWLRIATAAAVYAAWRRPWRGLAAASRAARRNVAAMGVVLGLMNPVFYLAIDRVPLGTVAAIEFLPVVALAAAGARTPRNAAALVAAVAGVGLVSEVRFSAEPLGIACAFANAALFALYIVLAHRVSREPGLGGIDGLAAAMLVALCVVTPVGGWAVTSALLDPVALAAGIGVGVTSSVIPYVCDQLAMRRLSRSAYALAVALLPATATAIGAVVLAQVPSWRDSLGICLVVAGVALRLRPDLLPQVGPPAAHAVDDAPLAVAREERAEAAPRVAVVAPRLDEARGTQPEPHGPGRCRRHHVRARVDAVAEDHLDAAEAQVAPHRVALDARRPPEHRFHRGCRAPEHDPAVHAPRGESHVHRGDGRDHAPRVG